MTPLPETRALFPSSRPSYPKESPATLGAFNPCTLGERILDFGAAEATTSDGPVFPRGAASHRLTAARCDIRFLRIV